MPANNCEIATVAMLPRNDAHDGAFDTMTHKKASQLKYRYCQLDFPLPTGSLRTRR